jgi:hypothetical protein
MRFALGSIGLEVPPFGRNNRAATAEPARVVVPMAAVSRALRVKRALLNLAVDGSRKSTP